MSTRDSAPFFSVIVPTYGVERYIADSTADILTQTFRDFELIVVDDCSPDRSIDIVRELAADDPRVRIVRHAANKGVSAARNTGIDEARGTWIMFLDPDDRYEQTLLQRVHDELVAQDVDLLVFGHVQEYYDASGSHLYDNLIKLDRGTYDAGPALGHAAIELEQQTHLGYPWNKAYRPGIIRTAGLRFEDDVPLVEDILFNVAYLYHARSVAAIPDALIRYAKRLGANLTGDFYPRYHEMHRRRIKEIRDFAEQSGALDDWAKATLGALYARFILSAIEQNSSPKSGMDHAARVAWLHDLFRDPLFDELVTCAEAQDSKSLAVCIRLLNARNVPALLALGRVIHIVRTRNTALYMKVKSRR